MIIIIGTSVCNQNHGLTTCGDDAIGKSCAFDLRVAGSSPAGQLDPFIILNQLCELFSAVGSVSQINEPTGKICFSRF